MLGATHKPLDLLYLSQCGSRGDAGGSVPLGPLWQPPFWLRRRNKMARHGALLIVALGIARSSSAQGDTCNSTGPVRHGVYEYFYQDCGSIALVDGSMICGQEVVNDVLSEVVGGIGFEATFGDSICVLILSMMLQIGGIPTPTERVTRILYTCWMLVVVVQWLFMLLSLLSIAAAYWKMREILTDCAVQWNNEYAIMDVIAMPSFVFQPAVLSKLMVMMIYWAGLIEGVKVWCAANRTKPKKKQFLCWGKVVPVDEALLWRYVLYIMGPLVLYSLACSLCSMAIAFGIVFFLPMALFLMASYLVIFVLLYKLCFWIEEIQEKRVKSDGVRGYSWSLDVMHSMVWWTMPPNGVKGTFQATIWLATALYALSPLVIYGTWMAAFVYAGNTTADNMQLIRDAYSFAFAWFGGADRNLLSFEFRLTRLIEARDVLLNVMDNFALQEPAVFITTARAFTLFVFVLAFVKPLINVLLYALAVYDLGPSRNAHFPDIAPTRMDDGTAVEIVRRASFFGSSGDPKKVVEAATPELEMTMEPSSAPVSREIELDGEIHVVVSPPAEC